MLEDICEIINTNYYISFSLDVGYHTVLKADMILNEQRLKLSFVQKLLDTLSMNLLCNTLQSTCVSLPLHACDVDIPSDLNYLLKHHLKVLFNQAYALVKVGRNPEAMEQLQQAKSKAAATSESRHKIISPALDIVMVSFTCNLIYM